MRWYLRTGTAEPDRREPPPRPDGVTGSAEVPPGSLHVQRLHQTEEENGGIRVTGRR